MTLNYAEFLQSKVTRQCVPGKDANAWNPHPLLFGFQRDVTAWAIRKGRAAVFLDTGLGKTFIQLEWARAMGERTLIIAPLSVARQTVWEAKKINLSIQYVRSQPVNGDQKLLITNYEMIDEFDLSRFGSVILDESSILKALDGKTRRRLTEHCRDVPYRLCCTATPAPNDRMEIGNHAEFLGVCSNAEMLAMFFVHSNKADDITLADGRLVHRKQAGKNGQEWRLKNHARSHFYRWLASWSMALRKPSDLGYDDTGYCLPSLTVTKTLVDVPHVPGNRLFFAGLKGIKGRLEVRRSTLSERVRVAATLVNASMEQWIVWTGLNDESSALAAAIDGAIEVKGSDTPEAKATSIEAFQDGHFRVMVTKPRIAGFGMNLQNAANMIFVGLADSWEQYYQSIRRAWRFGQTRPVNVHIVLSEMEQEIYNNVMRKDAMAREMTSELIDNVRDYEKAEITMSATRNTLQQCQATMKGNGWTALLGDACERLTEIDTATIDLSIYSPPFVDLYTYSASEADLGNSRGWDEFFAHYAFIIAQVFRVTRPGRLTCVHTSDIPAMAARDGYIGMKDFPGAVIKAHQAGGWIFVGRAFVAKNPQAQAIRVKSKALLFVQLRKDSSDSRPAIVDQVLLFKKPGENMLPVRPVANGEVDNEKWIEWANGIWLDVRESDVLSYTDARAGDDEKHICPLQLGTIERCVKLYSNPGETILSPFMGIGSEIVQAVRFGRKGIGIELKQSYFDRAIRHLRDAEAKYGVAQLPFCP